MANKPKSTHLYKGQFLTTEQLAQRFGITAHSLRYHFRKGRTPEQVEQFIKDDLITSPYKGYNLKVQEISFLADLATTTIRSRLHQGQTASVILDEIEAITPKAFQERLTAFEAKHAAASSKRSGEPAKYLYEGSMRTIKEIVDIAKVEEFNLRYHLRRGRNVADAIAFIKQGSDPNQSRKNHKPGAITYKGDKHHSTTHGMTNSPEFVAWKNMRNRCYDPTSISYPNYGGRGITVCERWRDSFENFYSDMGPKPSPKHSIDRKDNNGNYEPNNCRWSTKKEQALNKRNTVLGVLSDGSRVTVEEAAGILGLNENTIRTRIHLGIPLTLPVIKQIIDEKHLHEGKLYTVKELETITGIKDHTLRYHLRNGKTIPEIIKEVAIRARRVLFQKKWLTLKEFSKASGVPMRTVHYKSLEGKTVEQIVKEHEDKDTSLQRYPYQGKNMTIAELVKATGYKPKVLRKYLSQGKTVEETMKIVDKNIAEMKSRKGGIYNSA